MVDTRQSPAPIEDTGQAMLIRGNKVSTIPARSACKLLSLFAQGCLACHVLWSIASKLRWRGGSALRLWAHEANLTVACPGPPHIHSRHRSARSSSRHACRAQAQRPSNHLMMRSACECLAQLAWRGLAAHPSGVTLSARTPCTATKPVKDAVKLPRSFLTYRSRTLACGRIRVASSC